MNGPVRGGKPSLLEAGLPCASLSAECQRDNNARQRPPQNRLHIWWARRPPTVCRAAILGALLPFDLDLPEEILPPLAQEPSQKDLEDLPRKMKDYRRFFESLLDEVPPTQLTPQHRTFLQALGVTGDVIAAATRIQFAGSIGKGGNALQMPPEWGFRHLPAFQTSPSSLLLKAVDDTAKSAAGISDREAIVVLDSMAGGGVIPLEAIRYGAKVFANELNPVAATILKATLSYPAQFGNALEGILWNTAKDIAERVQDRMASVFWREPDLTHPLISLARGLS
jgi:putative DNA methylase